MGTLRHNPLSLPWQWICPRVISTSEISINDRKIALPFFLSLIEVVCKRQAHDCPSCNILMDGKLSMNGLVTISWGRRMRQRRTWILEIYFFQIIFQFKGMLLINGPKERTWEEEHLYLQSPQSSHPKLIISSTQKMSRHVYHTHKT